MRKQPAPELPAWPRPPALCAFFVAGLVMLLAAGCASSGLLSERLPVQQLHLLGTPIAVDLDGRPGADGLGVRVYASNRGSSSAIEISSGILELLLFDGALPAQELMTSTPLRVWTYPAEELRQHRQKTVLGTGYAFIPTWQDRAPTGKRVTVVARYRQDGGQPIYSAPVSVPLPAR